MLNLSNEDFREGDTVYFIQAMNYANSAKTWSARIFEGKINYSVNPYSSFEYRWSVDFTMLNGDRKVEPIPKYMLTKDKAWARARMKLEKERHMQAAKTRHILFETQDTIVFGNAPFNDCCLGI